MNKFPDVLCGWSWEENKLFELSLAVVDERHPDRWEVVAAMVGGGKTAEDVHKHYVILLEDLQFIESGKLDHELGEMQPWIQVDCTKSVCWTDDDNNFFRSQLAGSIGHKLILRAIVLLVYEKQIWLVVAVPKLTSHKNSGFIIVSLLRLYPLFLDVIHSLHCKNRNSGKDFNFSICR
ncbi:uncharacterized protein LOC120141307 isoform X1 [Hibiscus syriacus]|uniref:uncharacterized protein LOC120141307 isoform X1 n=1 Tax=Hibiscus syriacus TaxID=106335 RepID=UPI001920F10F|nr:uncharacterized protein LOC120141307 isoform X1 [Hibiscus syriacus]